MQRSNVVNRVSQPSAETGKPCLTEMVPQSLYKEMAKAQADFNRDIIGKLGPKDQAMMKSLHKSRPAFGHESEQELLRTNCALTLLKQRKRQIEKAGVTSSLGYNFYDLRGPAFLLYPVNTPFRNSLPRIGRVNDGVGTAAHWNATRNFGSAYAGAKEGERVAFATPDFNPYVATYKEIGIERAATFTSQFAGEGYTDNVADEHIRGAHELWLQEEGLDLLGNAGTGTGNNGFQLGVANTPVAALVALAGNVPNATTVSARVVFISALGNPNNTQYGYGVFPTVSGGLTPSYPRTNADNSVDVINGGTSQISASSNVVTTGSGSSNQVKFTVTPKNGTFGYAWFVDVTDASAPVAANAILTAITQFPTYTYNLAAPAGTQTGAATGLNSDHSFQLTDYDGMLTYAATQGRWSDQQGLTLTAGTGGSVVEIDADLNFLWTQYQAQPTTIWAASDAKLSISNTVLASSGGQPSAYRFNYTSDQQGKVTGGFVVDAYKSKFTMNPEGGDALPIRIHPMLPPGTIYYDIEKNPYPQSRIPWVRGMLVQREYYSIEWPIVSRQWTFGTYVHQVFAHMIPWISTVRTGIGPS
jgi:hypothetical protein